MRLEATGLAIGYGREIVGRDIAASVEPGRVLCLLGPNGCGKTTLFKTLLGLIPALAGSVRIGGDPLSDLSRAQIARRIAFVPQAHTSYFPFEALEIVTMGRTAQLGIFANPGKRDREIALRALERLGIADLAARDYSRLSGGQRQLVLIARALAQQTPLIVLDEPTANLDFGNQALVLREIAKLAAGADTGAGECGIVFSTHDPDQVFDLGADVMLMKDGRIVAEGAAGRVLTGEALSAVYGVAVAVETTSGGRRVCSPSLRTD